MGTAVQIHNIGESCLRPPPPPTPPQTGSSRWLPDWGLERELERTRVQYKPRATFYFEAGAITLFWQSQDSSTVSRLANVYVCRYLMSANDKPAHMDFLWLLSKLKANLLNWKLVDSTAVMKSSWVQSLSPSFKRNPEMNQCFSTDLVLQLFERKRERLSMSGRIYNNLILFSCFQGGSTLCLCANLSLIWQPPGVEMGSGQNHTGRNRNWWPDPN